MMSKKYKSTPNVQPVMEVLYFHGSRTTPPETIYTSSEGIDRRYTTGAALGLGAYFANNAQYSWSGGYVHTMANGQKQVFLARVCPGVTTSGDNIESQNWSVLKVNPATGKRFDSVTDNINDDVKRVMYVTFSNDQSYPQYVLTFT